MLTHPLLDQLDASLTDRVAAEPVELRGEWAAPSRRPRDSQSTGPPASPRLDDIVDLFWRGTLISSDAISGIAFLLTPDRLDWIKAAEASTSLELTVSLHAYAGRVPPGATFTAGVGGALLPGVPVAVGEDLAATVDMHTGVTTTGRVTRLADAGTAAVFVLLLPRTLLKVGRHHLWRLRSDIADTLPAAVRELLTRRRTGTVRSLTGGPG
jgi:hypothetical protein